jgi:hypothetical protein
MDLGQVGDRGGVLPGRLLAFADADTATRVEDLYTSQAGRCFDWLESQTAYGMRGHHGDGQTAEVVPGSGFLGWVMVHRAARPVAGRIVGDPHFHFHYSLANLTRGSDGRWSTVAAGGRDLMRHAPAVDKLTQALVRHALAAELGVGFVRDGRTRLWETDGVPVETLRAFSKRGADIQALLRDLGFDPSEASRAVQQVAEQRSRGRKSEATEAPDATLRELWQREARERGWDPDAIARRVLHRDGPDGAAGPDPGSRRAGPQDCSPLSPRSISLQNSR